MLDRKRKLGARGAGAEDDAIESITPFRHAIDEQWPSGNEGFDRPYWQSVCLRTRQVAKRRHLAGVGRQQIERDVAPIRAMQRVARKVECDTGGLSQVDRCRVRELIECDRAGLDSIVPGNPSGQHAGIDLAPVRRDEAHFPAVYPTPCEFGEHVHVRVLAAEQQQPRHAPGSVKLSSHARRRKSKPEASVGLTIAK